MKLSSKNEYKDDLYRAFMGGWMKGLDDTTPIDTLFAEWYDGFMKEDQ